MNNILVTGSNGQLGSEIQTLQNNYHNWNFFFTDVKSLDITNLDAIENFVAKNNINTIINCAAYTAVDKAEQDSNTCDLVNNLATENLAKVSQKHNLKFVHISTDYVFNGQNHKAYIESDNTAPKNVYGATKLKGELALQKINPKNTIIIRTSWVYSSFGNNFVKTMLKLAETRDQLTIIADQIGTPTYAYDLAKTILEILPKIENENVEIYHFSNEGICSWYDFAHEIFQQTKTACKVFPIPTSDYPTPAERPLFTLMNKSKIKRTFNIEIPHWKDSLAICIEKLAINTI